MMQLKIQKLWQHLNLRHISNMLEAPKSVTFLLLLRINMILSLFYLLGLLTLVHAAPQVKIGKTTLVGLDITGFKLDFFGGMIFTISLCVVRGSRLFYRYSFRQTSPRSFAFETTCSPNTAWCEDFQRQRFRPRMFASSKSFHGLFPSTASLNVHRVLLRRSLGSQKTV